VPRGVVVSISLIVVHPGPDMLELYLLGRAPTFDVEVRNEGERVVWRRLAGAALQAIVRLRVMGPSEQFVLHASWDQRDDAGALVPAGDYRLRGLLLTDRPEPLATAPVPLRIEPA
jgi:hypothetical protein